MDQFTYSTPIGLITIESNDKAITEVIINKGSYQNTQETILIKQAIKEIVEYINKERLNFDVPIEPKGTKHQHLVWNELMKIPYSETKTYKEIATNIGNPNSSRAVGNACNRNPIHIIIPCHRILGSTGKLTGYKGGLEVKEQLLSLENKQFKNF